MIVIPKKTIIIKKWSKKWKTVTIMCGVHGNETAGIIAVSELIKNIRIIKWKVIFIYANPLAIKENTRFIDKNMNRLFLKNTTWNSYEENRVNIIKKYLDKSDFLLDLHSSNSEDSKAFLITEHCNLSNIFPVSLTISWFNNIQSGWSDGYMDYIWGKWFCLESWSINDYQWIKIIEESVINFLQFTWNITGSYTKYSNSEKLKASFLYKTKSNKFKLEKEFWDFEKIKKEEMIWIDWDDIVTAKFDWKFLFARNRDNKWEEGFILLKPT